MTAALVVLVVALAVALGLVLATQRTTARRLLAAGRRLAPEVVVTGSGLPEATSLVERVVDRSLLRDDHGSVADARLAGALGMIPQGIAIFDETGGVAFRNPVAAGYLAPGPGEALVEEAIAELAASAAAGDEPSPRTLDLFGPPRRTLVLRAASLRQHERLAGVLVVIDDVTDRRRLEAVRRDFVANISHELKTPVGALALLAETLLAEDDPAVARRLAERMVDEAFRVDATIDDLLELSRIESSEAGAHEDVPVQQVLAEAVDRVRPAADQHGIAIAVEELGARLAVCGDRRQLVSATYNLLDNAVKYSDRGSAVEVRVRTDGRWADITVEDHGIGIPRRDLERVFERFYRVDRGRSRETGGTGLGLAIVRHVANNHSGEVRVDSSEGEGSTFTLRLPVGSGPVAVTAEAG